MPRAWLGGFGLAAIRSARSAALTLPEAGIAQHDIAIRNAPAACGETAGAALPGILSPRE
jgi:hypothetical protein